MAINLRATKNPHIIFEDAILNEDSPEGVRLFEVYRANHPDYKLTDGDKTGRTILMRAGNCGNVALVTHLVALMDKNSLNMVDFMKGTLFENFFSTLRATKSWNARELHLMLALM